jgi:hypothetical protein
MIPIRNRVAPVVVAGPMALPCLSDFDSGAGPRHSQVYRLYDFSRAPTHPDMPTNSPPDFHFRQRAGLKWSLLAPEGKAISWLSRSYLAPNNLPKSKVKPM